MSGLSPEELLTLRKGIAGTWVMTSDGSRAGTITLQVNGVMHMVLPATKSTERLRQMLSGDRIDGNWYLQGVAGRRSMLSSSVGSSVSSLIPKQLRNKHAPPPNAGGPWLVLNFQDLPKAVGNVKVFGARLDIINWIIAADELGTGRHIKLLDHSDLGKHVTVRMPDGSQQTWTPAR